MTAAEALHVLEVERSQWPAVADWLTENGHDDLSYAVRWMGRRDSWPWPFYAAWQYGGWPATPHLFSFQYSTFAEAVDHCARRLVELKQAVSEFPPPTTS